MNSLLDHFEVKTTGFRPTTVRDLFALRLAQRLGDAPAVRHFVTLSDTYSEAQLLCAYRKMMRVGGIGDRGKRFHAELLRANGNGNGSPDDRLIAIRVERRAVSAAIFTGQHLEYADSRQLSSSHEKAVTSAAGFVDWMLTRFPVESAALEMIENGHDIQRRVIHNEVCALLRERLLPIWDVSREALLDGFGHPSIRSRAELREIAVDIWPILAGAHAKLFMQEAAILGLHVQTERLFIINGTLS